MIYAKASSRLLKKALDPKDFKPEVIFTKALSSDKYYPTLQFNYEVAGRKMFFKLSKFQSKLFLHNQTLIQGFVSAAESNIWGPFGTTHVVKVTHPIVNLTAEVSAPVVPAIAVETVAADPEMVVSDKIVKFK